MSNDNIHNYISDYEKLNEFIKEERYNIKSFTDSGRLIDSIQGNSIHITSEHRFDKKDESDKIISKSPVIDITISGKSIIHNGNSLLAYEEGLIDIFDKYMKNHSIDIDDKNTPILNNIINSLNESDKNKKHILLIKSQSGEPIAAFIGNDLSYFKTETNNTISVLIDGKSVFIYKCAYSIYDMDLLL